jgi:hypothetical protein
MNLKLKLYTLFCIISVGLKGQDTIRYVDYSILKEKLQFNSVITSIDSLSKSKAKDSLLILSKLLDKTYETYIVNTNRTFKEWKVLEDSIIMLDLDTRYLKYLIEPNGDIDSIKRAYIMEKKICNQIFKFSIERNYNILILEKSDTIVKCHQMIDLTDLIFRELIKNNP